MKNPTKPIAQALMILAAGAAFVAVPVETMAFQAATTQAQTPSVTAVPSPSPPALSPESVQAVKHLQDVNFFAIGTIGIGGQTPPGEAALRVLLKEKNALPLFRGLLQSAKPAGQMYALMGVRHCSAADYAEAAAAYRTRKDTVLTMQGCLGSSETMKALTARMDKGEFVLWTAVTPLPPTKTKK